MTAMPHLYFSRALVLAAWCVSAPLAAWAQNDALITKRPSVLRDAPNDSALTLATLPAQTALTRLPVRQGAYVQVRTAAGATGWMHLFDLGSPADSSSAAATATGALRGITSFFTRGNTPSTTSTATTTVGIRGLGAEDIANAQPNPAALAQMEGQRQDAPQARRFAEAAALQAQVIEPLPIPAPPANAAGPAGRRLESTP
jgi:hypothetical protein